VRFLAARMARRTTAWSSLETLTGVVEVRTDSAYVEKCFNQNWHERWLRDGSWKGSERPGQEPRPLGAIVRFGMDERRDVTFEWIKGHSGDPNNNRVDRLARAAALSAG
jgi:ribonuclease HI